MIRNEVSEGEGRALSLPRQLSSGGRADQTHARPFQGHDKAGRQNCLPSMEPTFFTSINPISHPIKSLFPQVYTLETGINIVIFLEGRYIMCFDLPNKSFAVDKLSTIWALFGKGAKSNVVLIPAFNTAK